MGSMNYHGLLVWISYLAAPKGFALVLELEVGGVGPILGEESGLGVAEAFPDRGRSSSFRRPIWGVGGVELLANTRTRVKRLKYVR